MWRLLPEDLAREIKNQITRAVGKLVVTDPREWGSYVPRPLDFVTDRGSDMFGIPEEDIERNLDYLVEMLEERGMIEPTWEWGMGTDWDTARRDWIGVLTLRGLLGLRGFERL